MQEVELLIFDLDGTLVDTRQDIANSVNHVLSQFGLPPKSMQDVIKNVGDGVHKLLARSLASELMDETEKAVSLFKAHYGNHLLDFSRCYPGVEEVLSHFENKKLAIISNKPEALTLEVAQGLKLASRFSHILGGDSLPTLKPSPEPLNHVMLATGTAPGKTIMIGDSPSDILAGRKAGTLTCAVTYGFRTNKQLAPTEPDYIISAISELRQIVI